MKRVFSGPGWIDDGIERQECLQAIREHTAQLRGERIYRTHLFHSTCLK